MSKLSLIKWGFEGSMASEFPGLEFEPPNGDLPPGAPTSGYEEAAAALLLLLFLGLKLRVSASIAASLFLGQLLLILPFSVNSL